MRLLAPVPRLLSALAVTAALLVAVPVAPASAITTGGTLHVVSGATETFAPSVITVVRDTDLTVVNAPRNPSRYTYVLSDGDTSVSRGPIAPGETATFPMLKAGTYTLFGASAVASVVAL